LLKRTAPPIESHHVIAGPITIDDASHEVRFDDELVDLSKTEYRLLWELATRPGMVLSKEYLLESIWGIDFETIPQLSILTYLIFGKAS